MNRIAKAFAAALILSLPAWAAAQQATAPGGHGLDDLYRITAGWNQDTPTQGAALQPFAERTAPSKAVESRK